MDEISPLDAKVSLAASRAELLAAMGYEAVQQKVDGIEDVALRVIALPRDESNSAAASIAARLGRSVVGRWWRRQLIRSVVELGLPVLATCAHRQPVKFVIFGAAAGSLLYVLRPWKLLSAATVVTLIMKNFDASAMVSDLLNPSQRPDINGSESQL